jgi:hypothetical protein
MSPPSWSGFRTPGRLGSLSPGFAKSGTLTSNSLACSQTRLCFYATLVSLDRWSVTARTNDRWDAAPTPQHSQPHRWSVVLCLDG